MTQSVVIKLIVFPGTNINGSKFLSAATKTEENFIIKTATQKACFKTIKKYR